jgi:major membrane immunogen (membrane-anchored lipoprotein)
MVRHLLVAALAASSLLLGCSNTDCKSACDKLKNECQLNKVVSLDCSAGCAETERQACAECIDDKSCQEIKDGACNASCG